MKQVKSQLNNAQLLLAFMLIALVIGIIYFSGILRTKETANAKVVKSEVVSKPISTTTISVKEVKLLTNKPKVEMEIRAIADELNFKWADYLVRLGMRESSLNPNAISKPNRNGSIDYGLFQWNDRMPPLEITRECSLDLDCSTRMTIKAINLGMQDHWMTNELAKSKNN